MRHLKCMVALLLLVGMLGGCKPPINNSNTATQDRVLSLSVINRSGGTDTANGAKFTTFRNDTLTLEIMALWTMPEGANPEDYEPGYFGPAENETITWLVVGGGSFVQLADPSGVTITNANGLTSMNVNIAADANPSTYQIQAYADEEHMLSFTLQVKDVQKNLSLDGTQERTIGLGRSNMIRAYVKNQTGGPVQDARVTFTVLDGQASWDRNDNPIGLRESPLAMERTDKITKGSDVKLQLETVTNAQGIATAYFFSGIAGSMQTVEISAQDVSKKIKLQYKITDTYNNSDSCEVNDDCSYDEICLQPDGICGMPRISCLPHDKEPREGNCISYVKQVCGEERYCSDKECSDDGDCLYVNGNTSCTSNDQCASGAWCDRDSSKCVGTVCLDDSVHFDHNFCIYRYECQITKDCPALMSCDTSKGYCVPEVPGVEPLNVSGNWYAKYHYDLRGVLGIFAEGGVLANIIETLACLTNGGNMLNLDQAGDGQCLSRLFREWFDNNPDENDIKDLLLDGLANVLQSIVQVMVGSKIPQPVRSILAILNNMIHTFSDMQVTGILNITQPIEKIKMNGGQTVQQLGRQLTGAETWQTAYIYLPTMPKCRNGSLSKDWPECGQIDISVSATKEDALGKDNDLNFNAYLPLMTGTYNLGEGTTATNHVNDTVTLNRVVRLEMKGLINNLFKVVATSISDGELTSLTDLICVFDTKEMACKSNTIGGMLCKGLADLINNLIHTVASVTAVKNFSPTIAMICGIAVGAAANTLQAYLETMNTNVYFEGMQQTATVLMDPDHRSNVTPTGESIRGRAIGLGVPDPIPDDGRGMVTGTFDSGFTGGKLAECDTNEKPDECRAGINKKVEGAWGAHRDANKIMLLKAKDSINR